MHTSSNKHFLKKFALKKCLLQLKCLPENIVVETTEYKCLQSQFSVLYNESMQLKTLLEDTRNLMATSKNTHLRQIEQMEVGYCLPTFQFSNLKSIVDYHDHYK